MKAGLILIIVFICYTGKAQQDSVGSKAAFRSFFPAPVSASSPEFRATDSIYRKAALYNYGLAFTVFADAYRGYQYLLSVGYIPDPSILTIIDYSQSAKNRRLYVIDMKGAKMIYNTFVSHGRGSGSEYAADFSNAQHSNKSSLGFLITGETYIGGAGYSLRLDGVEPGINDQVRARNVVMHGSRFVNYQRIFERGTIANSLGCPAIPLSDHRLVIDKIKGGTCMFIYSDVPHYKRSSAVLNTNFTWPVLAAPGINN